MSEQSRALARSLKAAYDILNELAALNVDEQTTNIAFGENKQNLIAERDKCRRTAEDLEKGGMSTMSEDMALTFGDGVVNPLDFFVNHTGAAASSEYKRAVEKYLLASANKLADQYIENCQQAGKKDAEIKKAERENKVSLNRIAERRKNLVIDFIRGPYRMGDYPLDYAYPSAAEYFLHEAEYNNVDTMEKCMNNYRTKQYQTAMQKSVNEGFKKTIGELKEIKEIAIQILDKENELSQQMSCVIDGQKQIISQNDAIIWNQVEQLRRTDDVINMVAAGASTIAGGMIYG